jgi:hypothetical protein
VLVKHLPRDSAVNRELHGEAAEWGVTEHLLAATVDHLAAGNWMFATVNTGEDGDAPDPPVPVPRPGDAAEDTAAPGPYGSSAAQGSVAARAAESAEEPRPSRSQLIGFFS